MYKKLSLKPKYTNEVSVFWLQRSMNSYAECANTESARCKPCILGIVLTKNKRTLFSMVYIQRKQGSFLMCIKIYETILPSPYKNCGFAREFSEQYNYASRITNYALNYP